MALYKLQKESVFNASGNKVEVETGVRKDLTTSYKLDKGQNSEFYDFSSIVRNQGVPEPTKPLLIVFDHYTIPTDDSGDLFTVLSYDDERFATAKQRMVPEHFEALGSLLHNAFLTFTTSEIMERLHSQEVPAALVNSLDDLFTDHQV